MYYRRSFETRAGVRRAVIEFIERDYNRSRPRSKIGYQVPAEAMDAFFERTDPACWEMPLAA